MTHHIDLDTIQLTAGKHMTPDDGYCLLEAVALWANEPHSDAPTCVSPVLATFGRSWNDGMHSDEERNHLKRYIPLLPGTVASYSIEKARACMALDWLVRVHTPAWLRLAGLETHAQALEILAPMDQTTVVNNLLTIHAAWAAARDVARDTTGDATWAAVRDAAGAAARAAAWAAARAAGWDAARAAGWAAARAAGWDAARAAGWDAAWAAAWAAAGAAAGDNFEATITTLQASAHELFLRMIWEGTKRLDNHEKGRIL